MTSTTTHNRELAVWSWTFVLPHHLRPVASPWLTPESSHPVVAWKHQLIKRFTGTPGLLPALCGDQGFSRVTAGPRPPTPTTMNRPFSPFWSWNFKPGLSIKVANQTPATTTTAGCRHYRMTSSVPGLPVRAINELMFPHNPTQQAEFWLMLISHHFLWMFFMGLWIPTWFSLLQMELMDFCNQAAPPLFCCIV